METEKIRQLIEAGLPQAKAQVEGDGAHFLAIVICPAFANKSRIQKQQMVYDTVKNQLLDGSLHALSVKTYTQAEWDQQNARQGDA
jgi:acid stress-induced BolA-like protein IbaG/YrbA